jgi:hypothetical protein
MTKATPIENLKLSLDLSLMHPFSALQVLLFVTLQPSKWQNLVNSVDPNLSPNFSIPDLLNQKHEFTEITSKIICSYCLVPILTFLSVSGCLLLLKTPVESCIYGIIFGTTASFLISILGGFTTAVAAAIFIGVVGGISSGIAHGLPDSEGSIITVELFTFGQEIFRDLKLDTDVGTGYWAVLISSSMAASAIFNIAKYHHRAKIGREMSSIIFGSAVGISVLFLMTVLMLLLGYYSISLIVSILTLVIIQLRARNWYLSLLLSVFLGAVSFFGNFVFFSENFETFVYPSLHTSIFVKAFAHAALESIFFVIIFAAPFNIAKNIADEISGAVAGVLGSAGGYMGLAIISKNYAIWPDLFIGIAVILAGTTFFLWLPILLYPISLVWDSIVYFFDKSRPNILAGSLIKLNSAFWTDLQYLPLLGLDNHLLLVLERDRIKGNEILQSLSVTPQRWAVRSAQIELDIKDLEGRKNIEDIRNAHQWVRIVELDTLRTKIDTILYTLYQISEDIDAALKQRNNYNKRLSLARSGDRLGALLRELNRGRGKYSARFILTVTTWLEVVNQQIDQIKRLIDKNQEIVSPYIVGLPINHQQDIFVGRVDIAKRIEQLLMQHSQSPPVFLYGQRRMGKTSLLNNFGRLLTSSIIPMFADLQGPASSARSNVGFLYGISKSMASSANNSRGLSLKYPSYNEFERDPFIVFNDWLDHLEETFPGSTILLALDEFEVLEKVFNQNQLCESSILGTFRNIVQHRPRFRLLLSGANMLHKTRGWSSYLINYKTLKVGYLTESESRQLIVSPSEEYALSYEPNAVSRVIDLTRGHPYLIQLLCDEIIFLKNEQECQYRYLVTPPDVEHAAKIALEVGGLFFEFIESQVTEQSLCFLRRLARSKTLDTHAVESWLKSPVTSVNAFDQVIAPLLELDIIERHTGFYRFQVELIRIWFCQ